jgi:hypothetical protein
MLGIWSRLVRGCFLCALTEKASGSCCFWSHHQSIRSFIMIDSLLSLLLLSTILLDVDPSNSQAALRSASLTPAEHAETVTIPFRVQLQLCTSVQRKCFNMYCPAVHRFVRVVGGSKVVCKQPTISPSLAQLTSIFLGGLFALNLTYGPLSLLLSTRRRSSIQARIACRLYSSPLKTGSKCARPRPYSSKRDKSSDSEPACNERRSLNSLPSMALNTGRRRDTTERPAPVQNWRDFSVIGKASVTAFSFFVKILSACVYKSKPLRLATVRPKLPNALQSSSALRNLLAL